MSNVKDTYEIKPTLENNLVNIEEEKLPEVLAKRLELLEETNQALREAKAKEEKTSKAVKEALEKADKLIESAKTMGNKTAVKNKILWVEWTAKKEEINVLKENLQKIIKHGEESAEAQKSLVEIQSKLVESQTALLNVQERLMAYQAQIAKATKFLYGLSAYNMASIQSVLINLKAALSGASKEKLGEMAQQQLLLAMDQIKKQENIVLELEKQDDLIEDLKKQDEEQDSLIENLLKQDEEHDTIIEDLQKQDEEQDSLIENLLKQDEEHDTIIEDLQKQDEEQDQFLVSLDKRILTLEEENKSLKKDIEELRSQTSDLKSITSKVCWKIIISILAIGSLVLNIFQILGVL